MDSDYLPLAAAGAAGVLVGRFLGRGSRQGDQPRAGVPLMAGAGRVVGTATGALLRIAGLAAQGVGVVAVSSGSAVQEVGRRVESVLAPRRREVELES